MGKIKFSLLWFSKTKHQINCYCKTEKWEKLPSLCCHQEALPPLWNVAQNISGSSLYLNTWVRRWLWKLAGLYNRQDLRAINARANDYLSIEYCPEKKTNTKTEQNERWDQVGTPHQPPPANTPGPGWGRVWELKEPPSWHNKRKVSHQTLQCFLRSHSLGRMLGGGGWMVGQHRQASSLGMGWYDEMINCIFFYRNHSFDTFVRQDIIQL